MTVLYYNFYNISFLKLKFNSDNLLSSIDFVKENSIPNTEIKNKNQKYFIEILDSYFSKECYELNFDYLDTSGLTKFYLEVYKNLMKVSLGKTITYKQLAIKSGYPKAYRAVGSAMAKNKWPILIPCHRVKSVNSLGGYSSGLDMKKKLLKLEEEAILSL